ncbi:MAG: apolipoprotein N-acyltransferase, partial [Thermodesulfovibrionales bacterium]|nr:apolipoprotein N-acyltransferase [Thermodesulfovibrionales bacterium]
VYKRQTIPSMIVAPLFWTTLEYLRAHLLSGFPWSSLGYSQYNFLTLIQVSDIIGIYGISFLIVSFNGAITDAILYKKRKIERPLMQVYPTFVSLSIVIIVFIFVFVYGTNRLNTNYSGQMVKVAIIQGNIEQDKKWDKAFQSYVMNVYKELTMKSLEHAPDIVIWPETALPFYFEKDRLLTDDLISFQSQTNSYLLTGSMMIKPYKEDKKKMIYTNSAILFDKNAKISYIYDKMHLVPFGEYVPLRKILFFVNKLTYGIGDYTPGESYLKAITAFGTFGTVICYEIIFPELVRNFFIKNGAVFLVNITNDAWFGQTSGPYQHFSMAVFRAIENRKPIVRVANTGISGYIDSKGRVVSKTSLFVKTYAIYEIETNKTTTLYTKNGDLFIYFAFVLSIILLLRKNRIGGLE